MDLPLAEISGSVAPGAHAILILGQAGRHLSNTLHVSVNIIIMPLPPKASKLNPVENIWQFMRGKRL